jgi:LPXTG-motif cell wall-anchored protein
MGKTTRFAPRSHGDGESPQLCDIRVEKVSGGTNEEVYCCARACRNHRTDRRRAGHGRQLPGTRHRNSEPSPTAPSHRVKCSPSPEPGSWLAKPSPSPSRTSTPQALGGGFSGGASMAVPSKITVLSAPQTFTTTAAADGSFAFPLSLSEPGTYTLTAVGATSALCVPERHRGRSCRHRRSGTGTGTGLSNTGGNGAGLANTGADSSLVLWSLVGGGALVAGAASVVVVRRRANAEASA